MKHTKSILLAAIAAAAVGSASAQTTNVVPRNQINIAGSTAFRSVHLRELHNWATAAGPNQGYTLVASDEAPNNGTGTSALYTRITPGVATTTKGGVVTETRDFINVRCVGSEGGNLITGSTNTQGFYNPRAFRTLSIGSGRGTAKDFCTNQMAATITYSDCDSSVSVFRTASRTGKIRQAFGKSLTYAGDMAAINFAFCTTKDFPVNNITARQAQALLRNGHLPLSFFTGNPNDRTNGVFVIGRNLDSGTRTAILTETGVGSTTDVRQYDFNTNTRKISITTSNTLPGVVFGLGDGGDDSGGTLTDKVAAATNLVGTDVNTNRLLNSSYSGRVYLIGYSGANDINTKNLKALSYNGTAPYIPSQHTNTIGFQTNFNGIASGTYSLFSIGKVYYNPINNRTGDARTISTALIPTIATQLAERVRTTSLVFGNGHTPMSQLTNIVRRVEGTYAEPR
jgi:hypothetical protein